MATSDTIYLILTITGGLLGTGVSIGVVLYGLGQFRLGKKEVKVSDVNDANSTVTLFKNRADLLDAELKQLRRDFETYKKESALREEIDKKRISQQEDLIKTYAAVLQNRNPELEVVLKEIKDYLKEIRDLGTHNAKILEGQLTREQRIDKRDVNLESGRAG